MKYVSTLLKKFISVNDTPENIARNLILKTCEIEEVHTRVLPEALVIGKVKEFKKHPEADKLNVCQVDCGAKWMFEIVCGGENIAQNIYVPVALPSCFLPAIGIQIEPRKLKGITSNGMICSKQELWINEDSELHNIRVLASSAVTSIGWRVASNSGLVTEYDFQDLNDEDLGKPLKEKYPWLEGYVLEVDNKSLTNRPDLTWHFGIACELNAIYTSVESWKYKVESNWATVTFNKISDRYKQFAHTNIIETLDNSAKLDRKIVSKTDGLNSYILLKINNVNVAQSSFFTRLQMIDMWSAPRANWIDFSNLFMLMTGQPIHFFDADKVEWDVIVRNAKDSEEFTDLFEYKHVLKETDIVIADKKKILALAGVVWGLESGITESTKNILVEIANFDSVAVRKTWTRLGLRTDAELRYEKNINPVYSLYCLLLFLEELKYYKKDLWNYKLVGLDYFASKTVVKDIKTPKKVAINYQKMSEFIFGKSIEDLPEDRKDFEELANLYLEGLGFVLEKKWNRIVPFWRSPDDINITEDIYEEVARIYGYEKIDEAPLLSEFKNVPYTPYVSLNRKLEEVLVRNLGFVQTETYPWVSEKVVKDLWWNIEHLYMLQNPVNPEMSYLRGDLMYELVSHTARNSKFFDECKIFDIWKIRQKSSVTSDEWRVISNSELDTAKRFASEFVDEQRQLGLMMYQKDIKHRDKDPILLGKGMVKTILKELGVTWELSFKKTDSANFHPKKQAQLVCKVEKSKVESPDVKTWWPDDLTTWQTVVGFVWSLHPLVLKSYKMPENAWVVYVSLNLTQILLCLWASEHVFTYETLQDQIVYRDLCFVIDADKDFGWILEAVKKLPEIKDIEVFDVYAWANLGEGKKSLAFKMKIMGENSAKDGASMTTEQINEIMNKAIKAGESAGGKLRS